MNLLLVLAAYLLLFILIEAVSRRFAVDPEHSRKVGHILAGTSAAFLPSVISYSDIVILGLIGVVVVLISLKLNLFRSIHGVKRRTLGEVYFPLSIIVCALAFPKDDLFGYGVIVMGLSDGLAGIAGMRFGDGRSPFFPGKTYVGSATFLIVTVMLGVVFGLGWVGAIIAALLLTLLEASLSRGLDDLLPPVASALAFLLLRYL